MQNAEKLSITLPHEMACAIRALDTAIARGLADAEAGRVHSIDDVRAKMRAYFEVTADSAPP